MKRFRKNPVSKLRSQCRAFGVDIGKGADDGAQREVYELVVAQCGEQARAKTSMVDRRYRLPEKKVLRKVLKRDGTNKLKYRSEGGDCDDFAQILCGRMKEQAMLCDLSSGLAFGVVSGGSLWINGRELNHKMNIVVTSDHEVYVVEPQKDEWSRPDPRNQYRYIII